MIFSSFLDNFHTYYVMNLNKFSLNSDIIKQLKNIKFYLTHDISIILNVLWFKLLR